LRIHDISESEFEKTEGVRKLILHDNSRRFACIDLGPPLGAYVLSWRSDRIEPALLESKDGSAFWIGVDQRLAAVDLKTGCIVLSLALNSSLLQLTVQKALVAVLTESELLLFNTDFSIRLLETLPDLPDSVSFDGPLATIGLVNGHEFRFSTETGLKL
jgi:hypothetical protein